MKTDHFIYFLFGEIKRITHSDNTMTFSAYLLRNNHSLSLKEIYKL